MAIFGPANSRIEVRVIKLLGKPTDLTNPVYFDEYASLGEIKIPENSITRFIVPEDVQYGIEVTFKAGFQHGEYNHVIGFLLKDKTSKAVLYDRNVLWLKKSIRFTQDTKHYITTLPDVVIGGKKMTNAKLKFTDLVPDRSMPFLSETTGFDAEQLAGLVLQIVRANDDIRSAKPEHIYQQELAQYQSKMGARNFTSTIRDTIKPVENIDEQTFNKHGVSHEVKLSGGTKVQNHQNVPQIPTREFTRADKVEVRYVHFLFRSTMYLTVKKLHKTPIPNYLQPWAILPDHDRRPALKFLQDHDKEQTAIFTIAKAGDGADAKKIRKELFDALPVDRWRSWHLMVAREREGHFGRLQTRSQHWRNQEGKAPLTWAEPAKCTENGTEENEDDKHLLEPLVIRNNVIILDESPSRDAKRKSSRSNMNANSSTIKVEPLGSNVSLINREVRRPSKKAKLDSQQSGSASNNPVLAQLRQEEELIEQELDAAEKVAQLRKKQRENREKIRALEEQMG